jgi:hypothetical protein
MPADASPQQEGIVMSDAGVFRLFAKEALHEAMLHPAPPSGQNWTNVEHQELERLGEACLAAVHWHREFGMTDEGDPWVTVYDRERQRPVVHIARIDRRYVAAVSIDRHFIRTATLRAAINFALSEILRVAAKPKLMLAGPRLS